MSAASETSNPLKGTWRLIAWEIRKTDGRSYQPFGQDLDGYIGYADHGSMSVFMRLKTKFIYYAGKYEIIEDRVIHHVTIAGSPANENKDLIRVMSLADNKLSLTTIEPPPRSLIETAELGDISILIWERARAKS